MSDNSLEYVKVVMLGNHMLAAPPTKHPRPPSQLIEGHKATPGIKNGAPRLETPFSKKNACRD